MPVAVIVVRNAWTMPQERYNAEWVQEHDTGVVLDSFKDIREGVAEVTGRLDDFRAGVAGIQNRALFEIPGILGRILRLSDADSGRRRFHPAFPGRPVPASASVSILAAVARTGTAPPPNSARGSVEPLRARRHRRV